MKELELKYGCNPNQKPARIFVDEGDLPVSVLNGRPGYINLLDALNGWQLVKELKEATGLASAASFKHVSPAGAAVGLPLTDTLKKIYFVAEDAELSPLACAYARARGADRMSSFGDFISLSDKCDLPTARLIAKEVSDGIIAPDYEEEALCVLRSKKKGAYCVLKIDADYVPPQKEVKQVFGVKFEQGHNFARFDESLLCEKNIVTKRKDLSDTDKRDLLISQIILKYTQSNSVCFVKDGQAIGIGAGQQSRIHCTRLAAQKADFWHLRQSPKVLGLRFVSGIKRADRDNAIDVYLGGEDYGSDCASDSAVFAVPPEPFTREEKREFLSAVTGVALGSDAFFPFSDNIERARRSGVTVIAQPGGSVRDADVISACDRYGIAMCFTGIRLFHH